MKMLTEKIDAFAEHLLREEKSDATLEKYLRDVRRFREYAQDRELCKELVAAWKKSLMEQGYAVRSVNSMLASINSLLRFLGLESCRVKTIRMQRQIYCAEEKELTKAEYFRLLAATGENEQLRMVLQTICGTGIRVSELQHFTLEAIRRGEVNVDCKNKTRRILIPGNLKTILLSYARRRGIAVGPVFVNRAGKPLNRSWIWTAMKKLCEKAGVAASKVFPHNLRKLFARTFYAMEKDIAKLADLLGHSTINTTRIYIMSTGIEHRRKIEQLGLIDWNAT